MIQTKSFVFGLGTGLIILSILFYVAVFLQEHFSNSLTAGENMVAELTDEEIIERAKALGMIDLTAGSPLLGGSSSESESTTDDEVISDNSEQPPEIIIDLFNNDETEYTEDKTLDDEMKIDVEDEADEEVEEVSSLASEEVSLVSVKIIGGWSADTICRILEERGVVDNAERLKNFLLSKGVTKTLTAGTINFPENADYEEIFKILTKKVVY